MFKIRFSPKNEFTKTCATKFVILKLFRARRHITLFNCAGIQQFSKNICIKVIIGITYHCCFCASFCPTKGNLYLLEYQTKAIATITLRKNKQSSGSDKNDFELKIGSYKFPFQQINPFLHLLLSVCTKEKCSIGKN